MEKEGKYIYCIINAHQASNFGPLGIGGRGDEVYTLPFNNLSAVVSDSPIKKYRLSRENLIPHERAIEEVMKFSPVLPVRFCTIAEDEEKVRKILEREHDAFARLLKHMEDKKELGLKALFKKDLIYKDIVEKYGEVRKLKEELASQPFQPHNYQWIEIGKRVEAALQRERERYKEEILHPLSPLSVEFKENKTYPEWMIVNAAFLVEQRRELEFDQRVEELDAKYSDRVTFKYTGTVPPFNFVNLEINTGAY